ncbi:unnamed protein product [Sphagnum balticum]
MATNLAAPLSMARWHTLLAVMEVVFGPALLCAPSFVVYNVALNTTTKLQPLPSTVYAYGITILGTDVLVGGGWNNPSLQTTCWLYTASVNKWSRTSLPSLPVAIAWMPMITLQCNGQSPLVWYSHYWPYVFGGYHGGYTVLNTVYTLSPNATRWTQRTSMPQTLWYHTAVALPVNTEALVCGGEVTATEQESIQSQCYTYTIHNVCVIMQAVVPEQWREQ